MSDFTSRWLPTAILAFSLVAAIVLAAHGARTDSLTVDEPSHMIAGYAVLTLGDYRLSPDHPPLARALLALPLLGREVVWRADEPEHVAAWRSGDFLSLGRDLFESWNDGQSLGRASRSVAIAGLVALLFAIALIARERFGRAGAAVAVTVAAFDPTLLAHGQLATIDVPFALAALATLWTADRWLAQPSLPRLTLFALAFAAATLTKFSWFTLVPALVAMAFAARAFRGETPRLSGRTLALGVAAVAAIATVTIFAIWAAYGFRFQAARGEDAEIATMHVLGDYGKPRPTTPAAAWEAVFHDPATGVDRRGISVPLLRFARDAKLLPEAYLYGAAYVAKKGSNRASYLRGRYSTSGFSSYFPWAFAIKTPLPSLALFALGLAALIHRWRQSHRLSPLAWGSAVFAVVYSTVLAGSALNLGVRHLIPITPLLALAAGGAWPAIAARSRFAKGAFVALLAGLVIATCAVSPHLLGYFNETVGGWRNGHRYLADSNLDWGQDLLRLKARLLSEQREGRKHGETTVWLAQAGDPPLPSGLEGTGLRWLLGKGSHAPHPAPIAGGLYVISATELLGVYRPLARADAWRDPRWTAEFERLAEERANTFRARGKEPDAAIDEFEALRRLRLIARLSQREPDERIGTSLFVFRLSDSQVEEMSSP